MGARGSACSDIHIEFASPSALGVIRASNAGQEPVSVVGSNGLIRECIVVFPGETVTFALLRGTLSSWTANYVSEAITTALDEAVVRAAGSANRTGSGDAGERTSDV